MQRVTTKDGTSIAYERTGQGAALILVGGAMSDRLAAAPLASLLAQHYSVFAAVSDTGRANARRSAGSDRAGADRVLWPITGHLSK